MWLDLGSSPYSLEDTGAGVIDDVQALTARVDRLRSQGQLTDATLKAYFGQRRFEQIAESNALEGSTLNVGETQLAVLRGITITGHDPGYARDAQALDLALNRIVELAQEPSPTDLEQLREIHGLILGDRPGAGRFRSEPVTIRGSEHRPPKTWAEVMAAMETWDDWSRSNAAAPALLRAVVLHTWLTHIHPFIDGNGRTARAILNLELIRAGWPNVIIRRKDRTRYLDALAESDSGGDLGPITELVVARAEDALRDLEKAAKTAQGYDEAAIRLRERQERVLAIWNDAVRLLFSLIIEAAEQTFGTVGTVSARWYEDALRIDDYAALAAEDPSGNAWILRIAVEVPAVGRAEYLAWVGYRSRTIRAERQLDSGPSIYWSVKDPTGKRPWVAADEQSPGPVELTLELPNVDRWVARLASGATDSFTPSAVVKRVIDGIEDGLT